MRRSKKAFDSGILSPKDVQHFTKISLPTIRKYFDAGEFKDSFLLPGTQERRITASSLVAFMARNKLPIPEELLNLAVAYQDHINQTQQPRRKPA